MLTLFQPNPPATPALYRRVGAWLLRTTFAPKDVKDKVERLRLAWTAIIAGLAVFLVEQFAEGWWVSGKILFHLAFTLGVYLLTDPLAAWTLFRLPGSSPFQLAWHWRQFVEAFPHVALIQKAKLLLLITEHTGEDIELRVSFADYLKLLCAAAHFTQREWFATHVVELSKWPAISQNAREYFSALQQTHLIRQRFLIRPGKEVAGVRATDLIVTDTLSTNAKLTCIPEEILSGLGLDCSQLKDFALFDESLVIVADITILPATLTNAADYDPSVDFVQVHIFRSTARTGPYSTWKQWLTNCAATHAGDVKVFSD
jgi:hypothetical protein